jgi:hypothetical protein
LIYLYLYIQRFTGISGLEMVGLVRYSHSAVCDTGIRISCRFGFR